MSADVVARLRSGECLMNRWIALPLFAWLGASSAFAGEAAIPKLAASLVTTVHQAALKGEPAGLRVLMAEDFTSSFGGDGGIDEALALWVEDPTYLEQLAKSTAGGCELIASDEIACPVESDSGYRAGFKRTDGQWLFTYFVAGD